MSLQSIGIHLEANMLSQPRNSKFEELETGAHQVELHILEIVFNALFIIFVSCVFFGGRNAAYFGKRK